MIRFYLRNVIFSPATIISIIGLYFSMVIGVWPFDVNGILYSYQYTISLGFTPFFIPVASVLPFCYFQHMLEREKASYFILIRSKNILYTFTVCLGAVISGMVVMFGAFALFTITCILAPGSNAIHIDSMFSYAETFYQVLLDHPYHLYALMGIVFAINGTIWPTISLLCFSITSNRYVALSVPFIAYILMGYFAQSISCYFLDPGQLLLKGIASQWVGGGIPYLLIYSGSVIVICCGIWAFVQYRRLRYG